MGVEGFGNVRSISRFCECDLLSIDSCVLYSSGVILCCIIREAVSLGGNMQKSGPVPL